MTNLQLLCRACNMRKGIQTDQEFRQRYGRLLPADGGIPNPPIPQARFGNETQSTRAAPNVRHIYHQRFSAWRARRDATGALVFLAVIVLILIIAGLSRLAD